jgi:putative transposase
MGQIFRRLYYHVVWSTKERLPVITPGLRAVLLEEIERKCSALDCTLHAANAVEDHVHVALEIPPSRAVSDIVGQIKGATSHALNRTSPEEFQWQSGYGVVTFRSAELPRVVEYVANQEARHKDKSLSPFLESFGGEEA